VNSRMQRWEQALAHPNVQAFLRVIRQGESNQTDNAYRMMFGGELFEGSFADHPRRKITKPLGGKPITSSAAGAYQFLERTWTSLVALYGFSDFSPKNQDLGAVALIEGRKALDDVLAGKFDVAVRKCALEWASLPGSPYGQPMMSSEEARRLYVQFGGEFLPAAPVPKSEAAVALPLIGIATAVLPSLIKAAPDLIKIFNDPDNPDKSSRQRDAELAVKVLEVAKEATGAASAEEACEAVQTPGGRDAFQKAVFEQWFKLQQAAEKSTADARKYAIEYAQTKNVRTLFGKWFSITFLEFLSLVLVAISAAGAYMVLTDESFGDQMRGAVVTLILIGGFTSVQNFWLGSSIGSKMKDDGKKQE
jgi:muramidase (phage lysozyme)